MYWLYYKIVLQVNSKSDLSIFLIKNNYFYVKLNWTFSTYNISSNVLLKRNENLKMDINVMNHFSRKIKMSKIPTIMLVVAEQNVSCYEISKLNIIILS